MYIVYYIGIPFEKQTKFRDNYMTPKILCHIAGPSGCGKSTLMENLRSKFPQFEFKDLDDFDDEALAFGQRGKDKKEIPKEFWPDETFNKFFDKKQALLDKFIADAKRPLVLVGIHTELPRKFEFYTPNKFLMNVTAETSALRALVRSRKGNNTHSNHFVGVNSILDMWQRKNQAQRDILWLCKNGYRIKANQEIEDFLRENTKQ